MESIRNALQIDLPFEKRINMRGVKKDDHIISIFYFIGLKFNILLKEVVYIKILILFFFWLVEIKKTMFYLYFSVYLEKIE